MNLYSTTFCEALTGSPSWESCVLRCQKLSTLSGFFSSDSSFSVSKLFLMGRWPKLVSDCNTITISSKQRNQIFFSFFHSLGPVMGEKWLPLCFVKLDYAQICELAFSLHQHFIHAHTQKKRQRPKPLRMRGKPQRLERLTAFFHGGRRAVATVNSLFADSAVFWWPQQSRWSRRDKIAEVVICRCHLAQAPVAGHSK